MYNQLTSEQRYTISVLLQNRMKQKNIAKVINVSPSTVSREIRRNSGIRGRYNWETAQATAIRTRRKKPGNHSVDDCIKEEAKRILVTEQWSPEQISGALAKEGKHICHETIKGHIKSITTDNGTEFACHEMISKSLGVKIYFADPYSSWQKGGIENANGLIRQYVPKSQTFEHVSHQQITKYSKKINMRPRKK